MGGGRGAFYAFGRVGVYGGALGLSVALGSSEASAREGECRGGSMGVVSSADGTGGAAGVEDGVSLVWPFGSRFAAAMLTQPWGHVCVPGGGWIPRWRQPPRQRLGGLPYINHSRRALCKASICSRVMSWVGRV